MSVETIQSSKTWKIIFYVTATVLLLIAVGCCAWEGFRYVGISRMFVLLPLLFLLGLLLLFIIDGATEPIKITKITKGSMNETLPLKSPIDRTRDSVGINFKTTNRTPNTNAR